MENQQNTNAVLEKYDRESTGRQQFSPFVRRCILLLAVGLSLFHLYTSFAGPLVDIQQRSIHLYVLLGLAFLIYPFTARSARDRLPFYDVLTALLAFGVGIYMMLTAQRIIEAGGDIQAMDFAVGILALVLILDATRRVTGWALPILAGLFIVYGFYKKLSIYPEWSSIIVQNTSESIIAHLVYITEGVLGTAIGVSASYIIMFILFGAFLSKSGMGQFFNDLAMAIAGHTKGGPAKVAVIASGFLGSINGAAVANVVTTGAFTIPLMKKIGYHRNFAGAVEASASVGGQILPPIMGAAAFIMAENLAIPYTQIILAGVIPALLYYLGVILQVHFRASKRNLKGLSRDQLPQIWEVIKERGHLLLPMFILVFLLFTGKTPLFAAFWAIVTTVLLTGSRKVLYVVGPLAGFILLRDGLTASSDQIWIVGMLILSMVLNLIKQAGNTSTSGEVMDWKDCVEALENGARTTIGVAMACACVGIIVGIATLTGVAIDVANSIITLGEVITSPVLQLLTILFLTMIASIVLGMGLPSIPCYIITSTMAAPILLNTPLFREIAGSTENAVFIAHMFVFYFGIFANITPPVALAAFAGAGISGGDPNKTGLQAMRLSVAGFIVPFMFVFAPAMLFVESTWQEVLLILCTSVVGVFLLSVAVEGQFKHSVPAWLRILSGMSAICLIYPGLYTDSIGLLGLIVLLLHQRTQKNDPPLSMPS